MKFRSLRMAFTAAVGFCLLNCSAASAVDLFGYSLNTGQAPQTFNNTTFSNIASRFAVGASNVTVNDISYYAAGNGTVPSSIAIWTAKAGSLDSFQPDTMIPSATASFTANNVNISTKYSLNFASPVTLNANANYYVVVNATGITSTAATGYVASTGQAAQFTAFGTTNATPQYRLITSTNGGTTWASYSSGSYLPYSVGFTAVPEPSTYALGTIGTAVLAGYARRRKRA